MVLPPGVRGWVINIVCLIPDNLQLRSAHCSYQITIAKPMLETEGSQGLMVTPSSTPLAWRSSLNLSRLSFHCWRRVTWKLYSWASGAGGQV